MFAWLKSIFSSSWMKALLKFLLGRMQAILIQVGKENLAKIQAKIVEVSKLNVPNKEKLRLVVEFAKQLLPVIASEIGDAGLNLLVETLVNQLKDQKAI